MIAAFFRVWRSLRIGGLKTTDWLRLISDREGCVNQIPSCWSFGFFVPYLSTARCFCTSYALPLGRYTVFGSRAGHKGRPVPKGLVAELRRASAHRHYSSRLLVRTISYLRRSIFSLTIEKISGSLFVTLKRPTYQTILEGRQKFRAHAQRFTLCGRRIVFE